MYKKLPKTLYRHPHTKGWSISGYGSTGLLLFTSKKNALDYTNSDAATHGEARQKMNPALITKIPREDLDNILNDCCANEFGGTQAVIFNLTNDSNYTAIYSAPELRDLLQNNGFCPALNYDPSAFDGILKNYDYQIELANKIEVSANQDFDQKIINEIVLWKVNRYVSTNSEIGWLDMLNSFRTDKLVDEEKLREFLRLVLDVRGIRLAMASTFLRFRNPEVYQIIDERTYRVVIRNEEDDIIRLADYRTVEDQIDLYVEYLQKLKALCNQKNITFRDADRILYQFDIVKNGDFNN